MPDRGYVHAIVGQLGIDAGDGNGEPFDNGPGVVRTPAEVVLSGWGHSAVIDSWPPVGVGTIHRIGNELHVVAEVWTDLAAGMQTWAALERWQASRWSVGFTIKRVRKPTREESAQGVTRIILAAELKEITPTAIPAQPRTRTVLASLSRDEVQESLQLHRTALAVRQRNIRAEVTQYEHRQLQITIDQYQRRQRLFAA